MAKIDRMLVGEALVGDGNEVAHIDLIIGPRGSAAETAFAHDPDQPEGGRERPARGARAEPDGQAGDGDVQQGDDQGRQAGGADVRPGPARRGAMAVADCVAEGTIPEAEAEDLFISVGVFIHWEAADDAKIQQYNYEATKLSIERAVRGEPSARTMVEQKDKSHHPVRRLVERNQRLHQAGDRAERPRPLAKAASGRRTGPAGSRGPATPAAPQSTGWWQSLLRLLGCRSNRPGSDRSRKARPPRVGGLFLGAPADRARISRQV